MIVNLTYFKKQWPGFSSFGITNCRASSPNPRRTLYTLTALQFWLQLLSIIFLASCVLSQWYSDQFHKFSHLNPNGYRFVKFNYHASIVFQISDFIVSVYASFHLRNATSLYNNIQDVRIWIVVNNIYLLWTLTCFIFSSNTCESSIEICIRATTVGLFACYKVYIVYEIYKNDKSSYIFLEQGSMFTNDSSKVLNFLLALTIIVNYFDNWNARGDVIQSLRKKYRYDDEFDELNYELGVFYRITFLVLIMISCVYLKKATYVHNLAYIKFYMILQVADLLTTFLTCAVTSIRLGGAEIFTIASLVFVMNSYMLRITYKFYNEEIIMGKSLSIQIASTVNSVRQT